MTGEAATAIDHLDIHAWSVAEKPVALLLHPGVFHFLRVRQECDQVYLAMRDALQVKLKIFGHASVLKCTDLYDCSNFRVVMGEAIEKRVVKDIKMYFRNPKHGQIRNARKVLDAAIAQLSVFNDANIFPLMATEVELRKKASHSTQLYLSYIGCHNNLTIKPAKSYPPEAVLEDSRQAIIGLCELDLWYRHDEDGISEDRLLPSTPIS